MRIATTLLILIAAMTIAAGDLWALVGTPDVSATVIIAEEDGFPGVCDVPCFEIQKEVDVFLPGNPSAPGVCAPDQTTYVYRLTHLGGSGVPAGFIASVTAFEIAVGDALTNVTSAGFIPDGLNPSEVEVQADAVRWQFEEPPISDGMVSSVLFLCSPRLPGTANDNAVALEASANLDAQGSCIGPQPSCGDGIVDTGEECDDGNPEPGDGCSATCTIEPVEPPRAGCGSN